MKAINGRAAPRPGRRPRRRRWPVALAALGLLFMAASVFIRANVRLPDSPWALEESVSERGALGGFLAGIAGIFTGDAAADDGERLPVTGDAAGKTRKRGVYTFLLAGTDDGPRTDTIMVASIDVENHTMAIVSIPRDTYIPSAARSVKKINGAYGGKNIDRLLDETAQVTGFRPDFWILVNLDGFVSLIDAIGGIEYDIPRDMKYSDPDQDLHIDLKKGFQHLDGRQTMHLARYRRGYATQDLQRVETQRGIISAVIKKMLTPAGLLTLPSLKDVVTENVRTDLKWGEMAALAMELSKVDMDTGASSGTAPTGSKTIGGGSYQVIDKKGTAALINATVNPYVEDMTEDDISA
ncbi:MAG: LCP family protein [Oscillospiraceae bacterium]|nr:LCP family protein [Oscillospiraceae bacterium]